MATLALLSIFGVLGKMPVPAIYTNNPKFSTAILRAPAQTLNPGQVINTDPTVGKTDIPMIKGAAAVHYFSAEIVDVHNNSVPANELYCHHWLIYNNKKGGDWPFCSQKLGEQWGIGAELHSVHYDYGPNHGVLLDGDERWTMNLHIIRTGSVPGEPQVSDVQSCIECHCEDGTPSHPHGAIGCCPDHEYCCPMCLPYSEGGVLPSVVVNIAVDKRRVREDSDGFFSHSRADNHKFKPVISPKEYYLQYTV
eukprot:gene9102-12666_t